MAINMMQAAARVGPRLAARLQFVASLRQEQRGSFRYCLLLLPSVAAACFAVSEDGEVAVREQEKDAIDDEFLGQRSMLSKRTKLPVSSDQPLAHFANYFYNEIFPTLLTPSKTFCERWRKHTSFTDHEHTIMETFQRVSGSVAHIQTTAILSARRGLHFRATEIPAGTGSGFLWDNNKGYVVTNYHVVAAAAVASGFQPETMRFGQRDNSTQPHPVKVKLSGLAQAREAVLVGVDPEKDLAVLKLKDTKNLPAPLEIGSSNDLRVGQTVLAIGNVRFGLGTAVDRCTRLFLEAFCLAFVATKAHCFLSFYNNVDSGT